MTDDVNQEACSPSRYDELVSDIQVCIAQIGCIYPTFGRACYDEPCNRLAHRIALMIRDEYGDAFSEKAASSEPAKASDPSVYSLSYPQWICVDCGEKHGRRVPEVATWHYGKCGVCGYPRSVTEPRDFGHLRDGWNSP